MAAAIIPPRMPISQEGDNRGATPRVAVVIPCFNEEVTITDVVQQFRRELPDALIAVFDNNSTDRTVERAQAAGARVLEEARQGKGFVVQSIFRHIALLACRYTAKTEWSGRPIFFKYPDAWKREAHYLFRDRRSLASFSPKTDRVRFAEVEVWIESSIKTASLEILLNRKAPVIGLRSHESLASPESRRRFVNAIEDAAGKRMFTLCFTEDLPDALLTIHERGLIAGAQTPIDLPFYSPDYQLGLIMIEVSGAEQAAAAMRKTL
jgi:hypothetical protein